MNHDSSGRMQRNSGCVRNGVAYTEKLCGKMLRKFNLIVAFYFYKAHFWDVWHLAQAFLNNFSDEPRAVDRRIAEPLPNVRNGAEMVVVPMSYKRPSVFFLFFLKIFCVWDNPIHARGFFFGELYTHINDYNFIIVFKKRAVAADFLQSSQRNIVNRVAFQGLGVAMRFVAGQRSLFIKFAVGGRVVARSR